MVQLSLPSEFGYEKVAMASTAVVAEMMGFPAARIRDLQTAVSEACLNAIEHAHRQRAGVRLIVNIRPGNAELQVDVVDRGAGTVTKATTPRILEKVAGRENSRGWGMFLIESLVDHVKVSARRGGGKTIRMIIRLEERGESIEEEFEG